MLYYVYDKNTGAYVGSRWSDTEVENSTLTPPNEQGVNYHWDGEKWVGDHLTSQQKAFANLVLEQANVCADQLKLNAQILLNIAKIKGA